MAPVHDAACANDVKVLQHLLGEDPGLIEAEREEWHRLERPLHCACRGGGLEAVGMLLERGAAIDSRNRDGATPLMVACKAGRAEVVSLLLARGADPTLVGKYSVTALCNAACGRERPGSDHVAVIRQLITDGRVPIDAVNNCNRTAVWAACAEDRVERARVLLVEGGADHTISDMNNTNILAICKQTGAEGSIQLLKWYEDELVRAFELCKARALVDAAESISKAPEKVGAKTRAQAQKAREEAAPAYLRGRVSRSEALPVVEVVGQKGRRTRAEEEMRAVCEFVLRDLKEDLFEELMRLLRYRRSLPNEVREMYIPPELLEEVKQAILSGEYEELENSDDDEFYGDVPVEE